ncbi:hypothetical protein CANINC_000440 [Pichia inconspicua]|uniref:Uncharacterized protein n=1 Tax=Pichia inconspicua TaxID=52247 RepID=A0A4T0X893_9ASCO|nr:hypothetical protein CANINC_000440 [[Candida] inconspicua]
MENNTKEREQEQSYKEFCNRLDKWIGCINLGVDEPYLLSTSQLTKSSYTTIFHENRIMVLPPSKSLQNEIQKSLREVSNKWEKYAVEVKQEKNGMYKLVVNAKGEVKAPKKQTNFCRYVT